METTDIQPTKGHVLVELPARATQIGGIIIPDSTQANNAPVRGTVIRVPQEGSQFATGEVIFFRKYAIDELKFSEDDLSQVEVFIVDEREVLGVVRPLEVKVDNTLEVRRESKHADDKLRDSVK